jgi:hypothetical protein
MPRYVVLPALLLLSVAAVGAERGPDLGVSIRLSAPAISNRGYLPLISVPPEEDAVLEVTAANSGDRIATRVTVTVEFPEDSPIANAEGGVFECEQSAPRLRTCRTEEMAPGTAAKIRIHFATPPLYDGGLITFHAVVIGAELEGYTLNNEARETVAVNRFFAVTNTDDDGPGSLRQAILDANALCTKLFPAPGTTANFCTIGFRIPGPLPVSGFFTITPRAALPSANFYGDIHGGTEASWLGISDDAPRVFLDGSRLSGDADGLVSVRGTAITRLAIGNFPRFGIFIDALDGTTSIERDFLGIDPSGHTAAPNERGLGIVRTGWSASIRECVISGNRRSGIVASGPTVFIEDNRIGVAADSDAPLPNGASGIFLPGSSDVRVEYLPYSAEAFIRGNTIANHPHFGVAIGTPVQRSIEIDSNVMYANGGGAIDYGLDGSSPNVADDSHRFPNGPTITEARASGPKSTSITVRLDTWARPTLFPEYPTPGPYGYASAAASVDLYANDSPAAQTQHYLGTVPMGNLLLDRGSSVTGSLNVSEDLRGKWITAVALRRRSDCHDDVCRNTYETSEPSVSLRVR